MLHSTLFIHGLNLPHLYYIETKNEGIFNLKQVLQLAAVCVVVSAVAKWQVIKFIITAIKVLKGKKF